MYTSKPSPIQILENAKKLLQERGWVNSSSKTIPDDNDKTWVFGPETGPLTLQQTLFRGGLYKDNDSKENYVNMLGIHTSANLLCRELKLDNSLAFVYLGRWCKKENRTQEDVIILLANTVHRANTRLIKAIFSEAETVGSAEQENNEEDIYPDHHSGENS